MATLGRWALRGALLVAALASAYVGAPYAYVFGVMVSSNSEFGQSLSAAENMRKRFPQEFETIIQLLNKLQTLVPNYYAAEYYAEERPKMLEHIKSTFTLHPYFAMKNVPNTSEWYNLIHTRVKHFRMQMDEHSARDFEVEKDRCKMYDFFGGHGIPTLPTHGTWRSLDSLIASVQDGSAFGNVSSWPVFWKACHLTQSSSYATRAIHRPPAPGEETDELVAWLKTKWHFRANDVDRVWVDDGNAITRDISPGFMLQAPFTGAKYSVKGRIAVGLPEVRVEVIWGRAYLGNLDGCMLMMRNGGMQDFGKPNFGRTMPVTHGHWFFTEGHDKCAFEMAERAAMLAGSESIRIDIFLDRCVAADYRIAAVRK